MDDDKLEKGATAYVRDIDWASNLGATSIRTAYLAGAAFALSDVPTGQSLLLIQINGLIDELNGAAYVTPAVKTREWLLYIRDRLNVIVKAVAADTNEECETASQAHTGTKD